MQEPIYRRVSPPDWLDDVFTRRIFPNYSRERARPSQEWNVVTNLSSLIGAKLFTGRTTCVRGIFHLEPREACNFFHTLSPEMEKIADSQVDVAMSGRKVELTPPPSCSCSRRVGDDAASSPLIVGRWAPSRSEGHGRQWELVGEVGWWNQSEKQEAR